MRKKVLIILSLFIVFFIILEIIFIKGNKDNVKSVNEEVNNYVDIDSRYYDADSKQTYVPLVLREQLNSTYYERMPVSKKFINKFKDITIPAYFDLEKYIIFIEYTDYDEINHICYFDCCYDIKGSDPLHIKKVGFKYYLDDKGFLDDIELVSEEVYRDDDGVPVVVPNKIKIINERIFGWYLTNIVYGLDLLKYKIEDVNSEEFIEWEYEDIKWNFDEFAFTDKLKNNINIYEGLISKNIKDIVYNKHVDIKVDFDTTYIDKKNIDSHIVYLKYDNSDYEYILSYIFTDEGYLDELKFEKK